MIKATKPNQTEVFPMNQFNKEIAQALLENTNLTEVFRNQLESTMNSLSDLHHIIKIETAKNGGNVKKVMDQALEEYIRKYLPDKL
ncbi:hypothetical protein [Enterococcus cecorum]|uniref:hypothetical protein n=2 Tax=Enterococcus cecorum TaxID=44008 RepID=UPI003C2FB0C5